MEIFTYFKLLKCAQARQEKESDVPLQINPGICNSELTDVIKISTVRLNFFYSKEKSINRSLAKLPEVVHAYSF